MLATLNETSTLSIKSEPFANKSETDDKINVEPELILGGCSSPTFDYSPVPSGDHPHVLTKIKVEPELVLDDEYSSQAFDSECSSVPSGFDSHLYPANRETDGKPAAGPSTSNAADPFREQRENFRLYMKEYRAKKYAALTDEQRAERRDKINEKRKLYRARIKQEKRDLLQQQITCESPAQRAERLAAQAETDRVNREKYKLYTSRYRAKKRATETEEERVQRRAKEQTYVNKFKAKTRGPKPDQHQQQIAQEQAEELAQSIIRAHLNAAVEPTRKRGKLRPVQEKSGHTDPLDGSEPLVIMREEPDELNLRGSSAQTFDSDCSSSMPSGYDNSQFPVIKVEPELILDEYSSHTFDSECSSVPSIYYNHNGEPVGQISKEYYDANRARQEARREKQRLYNRQYYAKQKAKKRGLNPEAEAVVAVVEDDPLRCQLPSEADELQQKQEQRILFMKQRLAALTAKQGATVQAYQENFWTKSLGAKSDQHQPQIAQERSEEAAELKLQNQKLGLVQETIRNSETIGALNESDSDDSSHQTTYAPESEPIETEPLITIHEESDELILGGCSSQTYDSDCSSSMPSGYDNSHCPAWPAIKIEPEIILDEFSSPFDSESSSVPSSYYNHPTNADSSGKQSRESLGDRVHRIANETEKQRAKRERKRVYNQQYYAMRLGKKTRTCPVAETVVAANEEMCDQLPINGNREMRMAKKQSIFPVAETVVAAAEEAYDALRRQFPSNGDRAMRMAKRQGTFPVSEAVAAEKKLEEREKNRLYMKNYRAWRKARETDKERAHRREKEHAKLARGRAKRQQLLAALDSSNGEPADVELMLAKREQHLAMLREYRARQKEKEQMVTENAKERATRVERPERIRLNR